MIGKVKDIVILMVDDDPDDFLLTRDALQQTELDVKLYFLPDCDDLMDYLTLRGKYSDPAVAPRPDMILLDLNMPKTNGKTALSEIKSKDELKKIPVIVYTTSKDKREISECYNLGADIFVSKPDDYTSIVRTMESLVNYWILMAQPPSGVKNPIIGR